MLRGEVTGEVGVRIARSDLVVWAGVWNRKRGDVSRTYVLEYEGRVEAYR